MRILVYPHAMEIGGSQLNAISLAGAVRDLGHDVAVISRAGPLVQRVHDLELDHVEIPAGRGWPSVATAWQLRDVVRRRRIDVVHGYEWPPVIEACWGPRVTPRVAVVATVLSMSVVPFFPRTVPLAVGSEVIRDAARAAGHRQVVVVEPPVDTDADHPSVDGRPFRARYGIESDEVLVAMICRLVPELKLEGLLATCDAVGELAKLGHPVRLVIVGDGRARDVVAEQAARASVTARRPIVTLTGEASDPRQAYAAADVIVGQGGSALRGMAFGKPLVVVGEDGFSELLTPATASLFLRQGWYGRGPGSRGSGPSALAAALARLIGSAEMRRELGDFSRGLVVDRFGLRQAARVQESVYESAVAERGLHPGVGLDLARGVSGVFGTKVRDRYQRRRGVVTVDDANAQPLTEPGAAGRQLTDVFAG